VTVSEPKRILLIVESGWCVISAGRKAETQSAHSQSGSLHDFDSVERRGKRQPTESHRQAPEILIFRLFPSDPHARAAGTPTGGSLFLQVTCD